MKQKYYSIYENLYRNHLFRTTPWGPDAIEWILRQEIDAALADLKLGDRLRPDARYFLLTNTIEMILRPLTAANDLPLATDLIRDAQFDLKNILEWAEKAANRRHAGQLGAPSGKIEISARDIIEATASHWDEIKLNKLEAWG